MIMMIIRKTRKAIRISRSVFLLKVSAFLSAYGREAAYEYQGVSQLFSVFCVYYFLR